MHTELEHLYRIYSIPTHDKHQWLLLHFTYSVPDDGRKGRLKNVVVNKHNNDRVASCWFIMYYGLVMHGNANIKLSEGT